MFLNILSAWLTLAGNLTASLPVELRFGAAVAIIFCVSSAALIGTLGTLTKLEDWLGMRRNQS